ncbi:gamma-glutamyl-gamma-aminobutyrate hydrolase family protein [Candidatus Poriferisocius sp.]|uniref:gamma-glutamyl-gamma-aminobutyrate hydrolase family protein n=1 Tax=Candidatus Poriferisocius sp. TaxID=3101276 RepID=UPI003B51AA0C
MATKPPLIGLPGRRKRGSEVRGLLKVLDDCDLDLYFADYARGVIEAGGIPVHIPIDVDPAAVGERLDGLVLPGGTDIDPIRYGADPDPELLAPELERDDLELGLLSAALDADIPVLGICRGIQVLNVHQGGTLHQHVPEHNRLDISIHSATHRVNFAEDSTLYELYGPSAQVNSLHHQAVANVGRDLTVTAQTDDGTIEGLEMGDSVVTVQWHPEMMPTRPTDPIFRWLVDRASC